MNEDLLRIPIADVIAASGLTVMHAGRYFTTKEHDSLIMWPRENSWYWFSRGHGGNVINWVMYVYGKTFKEACEYLERKNLPPAPITKLAPAPPPVLLPQDLHVRCHAAMQDQDVEWWFGRGLSIESQARWFNGVCQHPQYGLTYTIPVIEAGKLVNMRLRLSNPIKSGDKYRPYDAGRGTQLFNADALTTDVKAVVIVAGEIKAEVLSQSGFISVSPTGGCSNWRPDWTARLRHCTRLYVAFDPGEEVAADKLATQLDDRVRLVALPDKPDDFLLTQGENALRYHLKHALPLAAWRKRQEIAVPDRVAAALYERPEPLTEPMPGRVPWRKQLLIT